MPSPKLLSLHPLTLGPFPASSPKKTSIQVPSYLLPAWEKMCLHRAEVRFGSVLDDSVIFIYLLRLLQIVHRYVVGVSRWLCSSLAGRWVFRPLFSGLHPDKQMYSMSIVVGVCCTRYSRDEALKVSPGILDFSNVTYKENPLFFPLGKNFQI